MLLGSNSGRIEKREFKENSTQVNYDLKIFKLLYIKNGVGFVCSSSVDGHLAFFMFWLHIVRISTCELFKLVNLLKCCKTNQQVRWYVWNNIHDVDEQMNLNKSFLLKFNCWRCGRGVSL